jgi:hypothetical protein
MSTDKLRFYEQLLEGRTHHFAWELIREVKRLRDELGKQMEYIEWLEEFAPKAGKHNTSWEAYELAKESEEE